MKASQKFCVPEGKSKIICYVTCSLWPFQNHLACERIGSALHSEWCHVTRMCSGWQSTALMHAATTDALSWRCGGELCPCFHNASGHSMLTCLLHCLSAFFLAVPVRHHMRQCQLKTALYNRGFAFFYGSFAKT